MKRWISLVMCVFVLLGTVISMPDDAVAAVEEQAHGGAAEKVVDEPTVENWQKFFGPEVRNTINAGGVWTDKSVFNTVEDYIYATAENEDAATFGLELEDEDNFLVVLSAIASTKSIEGYTNLPSDTMLVLDLSGSMEENDAVDAMIQAANAAIEELLQLNSYNRVGVVAYSGNTAFGDSATSTATVLLPLGRYSTTATDAQRNPVYLLSSWREGSGSNARTVTGARVSGSVTRDSAAGGASGNINTTGKEAAGGTYIQNGLYQAWQQFAGITDTSIQSGLQAGIKRMPIMVLLSDGSPTSVTDSFSNIDSSNLGNGGTQSATDGSALLTQLTASWVRDKMEEKYGETPLFYTLGLKVGSESAAQNVLDPANHRETDSLWNRYVELNDGQSMRFLVMPQHTTGQGSGRVNWAAEYANLNYIAPVFSDKGWNQNYVDQYFPAENTRELIAAFDSIVERIVIQSMYYPTLVEGGDHNEDGFLQFEDYIGQNMEVKGIKGIQLGNKLYTGATMARLIAGGAGSIDNPTDVGNNLIWSIQARMMIKDVEIARELVGLAYRHGQLAYNSETGEFSNYIGWFADSDGAYVAFWDGTEESLSNEPSGAVYAIKSYGYYDAVGEGHRATDMMYATIQIRREIATGITRVIGRLPASLIPLVEYNIEIEGSDPEEPAGMTIEGATSPSRLLYEVGLDSRIDLMDIENTAPDEEALDKYKQADGSYVFYTNQWNAEMHGAGDNTYSKFSPSMENERYYYHEDTPIYVDQQGTLYKGDAPSSTGEYYRRYLVYDDSDGSIDAKWVYERISEEVLSDESNLTQQDDQSWVVNKGIIHRYLADYIMYKLPDNGDETYGHTGTLAYSDKPDVHILSGEDHYHIDSYLGNNGKLTIDPYEGIRIQKTADDTILDRNQAYSFVVNTEPVVDSAMLVLEDADGTRKESEISFTQGAASVSLKHGQIAYIVNLPKNTVVTVEEEIPANAEYRVSSVSVTGDGSDDSGNQAQLVVKENAIVEAHFVNTKVVGGDVVISKSVNSSFDDHRKSEFDFTVSVAGSGVNVGDRFDAEWSDGTTGVVTIGDGGIVSPAIQLAHNEALTILGLPDGAVVTVEEEDASGAGFSTYTDNPLTENSAVSRMKEETIVAGGTKYIHFTNTYKAAPVTAQDIEIHATKHLDGDEWSGGAFSFRLERYNSTTNAYETVAIDDNEGGNPVSVVFGKNDSADKTFAFTLSGETYDAAGSYSYRVIEVIPDPVQGGIVYDTTPCYFDVVVSDNGEGQLVVSNVLAGTDTTATKETTQNDGDIWKVSMNFYNRYEVNGAAEAIIHIDKTIESESGVSIPPSGFSFGLYEANSNYEITDNSTPVSTSFATGADGKTDLSVLYTDAEDIGTHYYVLKEIVPAEGSKIAGVSYSEQEYHVKVSVGQAEGKYTIAMEVYKPDGTLIWQSSEELASVVAAPGFAVNENKISLTCSTEDAQIYYKLGSDSEFALYAGPIEVNGETTIVAYGQKGTAVSAQVSATCILKDESNLVQITEQSVADPDHEVVVAEITSGVAFKNTYTPAPVRLAVPITGSKILNGREQVAEEFSFGIYSADEDFKEISKVSTAKTSQKEGQGFGFEFAPTFNHVGEYYYVIREEMPEGVTPNAEGKYVANGITYDDTEYHVTVSVTGDNSTGALHAQVTSITNANGQPAPIVFHNSYQAEPTQATISGTKVLNGIRKMQAGNFEFELVDKATNAVVQTVSNEAPPLAEGNEAGFSFVMDYDTVGEFTYMVREKLPPGVDSDNKLHGVQYDTKTFEVKVEVTDNGAGQLSAEVTYVNGAVEFTNTYLPDPVGIDLEGKKNLEGDLLAKYEGQFKYELYRVQYDSRTGQETSRDKIDEASSSEGSFSFSHEELEGLNFQTFGDYWFVVKEHIPVDADEHEIVYDDTEYRVEVKVTDDLEGHLEAKTIITKNGTGEEAEIVFNNAVKFAPITVGLSGIKNYNVALEKGQFTFALYKAEEINGVISAVGEPILQATNEADGSFKFEEETALGQNSQQNAASSHLTFTEAGTRYFVVKEKIPEGADSTHRLGNITYDPAEYTVKVDVSVDTDDTGRDVLVPTIEVNGQVGNEIEFTNTLSSEKGAVIGGSKTLTGKTLEDGAFTFELYQASLTAEGVAEAGALVDDATNVGHAFYFSEIQYTEPGTYYYIVSEKQPSGTGVTTDENGRKTLGGVEYDTAKYLVTIEVGDTLAVHGPVYSKLDAENKVMTSQKDTDIHFVNNYEAEDLNIPMEIQIGGSKEYLGGDELIGGLFTFQLYRANEQWETIGAPIEATNDENGAFVFKNQEAPDHPVNKNFIVSKPDTYYFVAMEKAGLSQRVSYDETRFLIRVEVKDNGDGTLYVDESTLEYQAATLNESGQEQVESAKEMAFVNTYKPEGIGVTITGMKKLIGTDGKDEALNGKRFSFAIYETQSDYALAEDAKAIATVQNDETGEFQFNLTVEESGNKYYVIKELDSPYANIRKDPNVYHVCLEVSNNNGTLIAAQPVVYLGSAKKDKVEFINTYKDEGGVGGKVEEIAVELMVEKRLENAKAYDGGLDGFVFELLDKDGAVIETATSDQNGKAVFKLFYTDADVGESFGYFVRERNTGIADIAYSTRIYRVNVQIGSTGVERKLYAQVMKDGIELAKGETFVFANVYKGPGADKPGNGGSFASPKTGDSSPAPWIVVMAMGALGLVASALYVIYRRYRRE